MCLCMEGREFVLLFFFSLCLIDLCRAGVEEGIANQVAFPPNVLDFLCLCAFEGFSGERVYMWHHFPKTEKGKKQNPQMI